VDKDIALFSFYFNTGQYIYIVFFSGGNVGDDYPGPPWPSEIITGTKKDAIWVLDLVFN